MEISTRARKRRGNSRYYLFFFVSLLGVAALGIGTWYTLTNLSIISVNKITLEGNVAVPDSLIRQATAKYMGLNILSVPSSQVRADLKRFSRIKDVKVRKKLMHTLHLEITERKGVIYIKSFEGDLFPIDAEGVLLAKYTLLSTEDMPILSTYFSNNQLKAGRKLKKPYITRVLNLHKRILEEAPEFVPLISEYYMIDNTINIVDAKYGTRIIPSEEDLASQLKRYLFVQDNGNIDRRSLVDLRFKNQVVVKAGNK